MIGGAGDLSGVPRRICQLADALRDDASITVISDKNNGGFDALETCGAAHNMLPDLTMRGLIRTLNTTQADLIWLHAPYPALMARLARVLRLWRPACPVAFSVHANGSDKGHPPLRRLISAALDRIIMAIGPKQHTISLTHAAQKRSGNKHPSFVLQNCANLGPLHRHRNANTPNLIMTGRISRQKDHHRAFRLFQTLPDDMHLTLCGPGTDSDYFKDAAAALLTKDAYDRVTFVGPVRDIRPYMACADAYLLTSRYEGQPIGALEAFEAGLPIILSNFDGAQDLVDLHPCALLLGNNPVPDALRISALIETYRHDEAALCTRIQAVWRTRWSPDVFAANARALIQTILKDAA